MRCRAYLSICVIRAVRWSMRLRARLGGYKLLAIYSKPHVFYPKMRVRVRWYSACRAFRALLHGCVMCRGVAHSFVSLCVVACRAWCVGWGGEGLHPWFHGVPAGVFSCPGYCMTK